MHGLKPPGYAIAAVVALGAAVAVAWWLHGHERWGQPIESAAAVAAALLTAVTAVAAAASAASSSRAARDATAALEQHDPPDFQIAVDNDLMVLVNQNSADGVVPVLHMGFGKPISNDGVRLNAKVSWTTESGEAHKGRLRDTNSRLELRGCGFDLSNHGGMFVRLELSDLEVEFTDPRGRRWLATLEKDELDRVMTGTTVKYLQHSLRYAGEN
jgi:hypothetical protein